MQKRVRKICLAFTVLLVLFGALSIPENAEAAAAKTMVLQIGNPVMTINGTSQEIDPGRGTTPINDNGSTLLPIRAIVEAMGGYIGWEAQEQRITMVVNGRAIIHMILGSKTAQVNLVDKPLNVPAKSVNGRTMVPVRFVSENLGCTVDWNGTTQSVTINYTENPADKTNWTGIWETGEDLWGNVSIIQEGSTIKGIYYVPGQFEPSFVQGTVSGNTIDGQFTDPGGYEGKMRWAMSDDGKTLTGKWAFNSSIEQDPETMADPENWGNVAGTRKLK